LFVVRLDPFQPVRVFIDGNGNKPGAGVRSSICLRMDTMVSARAPILWLT
jgi:hypothetical protein